MEEERLTELVAYLNSVRLYQIEEFEVGRLVHLVLFFFYNRTGDTSSVLEHLYKMLGSTFTVRIKVEKYGDGSVALYCPKALKVNRPDHYQNFLKVNKLLKNKVVITGENTIGVTFKFFSCLRLPFVWNMQLKEGIKDRKIRWHIIHSIYNAYITYLEYKNIEELHGFHVNGLLLMEEHSTSSQMLEQYFKRMHRKVVVLSHAFYAGNEELRYYIPNWDGDYLLLYSQYLKEQLESVGKYRGELRLVGMHQYINQVINKHEREVVKKIGIFLDGGTDSTEFNIKMIRIVIAMCINTDIKIYIKAHPSSTFKEIEYIRNNIDMKRVSNIYSKEPLSIELEQDIDLMICRNTTCFIESVFQKIPTFIYDNESIYRGIDFDIYFKDEEDLKRQIAKVGTEEFAKELDLLKDYICGPIDPGREYQKFFTEMGWS